MKLIFERTSNICVCIFVVSSYNFIYKYFQRYKETVEKAVCCNGWEYSVDKDICTPICRTGCVGGRCVAPEVCHCDPPSTLDPAHKNTCIKPKCDNPCVNSDCINNSCICYRGFTKYNTTHCHKCDSGFFLSDDFDCLPICDNPCLNGKCTAPDTCTCLDGYAQKDNITCEPICNCINATCVAPNKCLCFEGYMNLNESTCVPQCDDCDGECVEPNVCKCKEGYSSFNGTCKPSCEKCESGECLKTGLCREEDADRNETANNLKNNLCKTTVT